MKQTPSPNPHGYQVTKKGVFQGGPYGPVRNPTLPSFSVTCPVTCLVTPLSHAVMIVVSCSERHCLCVFVSVIPLGSQSLHCVLPIPTPGAWFTVILSTETILGRPNMSGQATTSCALKKGQICGNRLARDVGAVLVC